MSLTHSSSAIAEPLVHFFSVCNNASDKLLHCYVINCVKINMMMWGLQRCSALTDYNIIYRLFTAQCTLVQSAVLRSHVVCLSVRPSVTLVDCDHIGRNSSKIISSLVSPGCSLCATPTGRVCSKGNAPKFGPKVTHPLLTWASETFDRKLRPNGYR